VIVLIGLLVLTIVLFGAGAADGPLQVALFLSATFAALVAYKNRHAASAIEEMAIGGVSSAMGAIFILLASPPSRRQAAAMPPSPARRTGRRR